MPASPGRLRAVAVGISTFALVAIATSSALAGSNPATLYACYNTSGQVAMSDIGQCKLAGGGRLVYWSTAGIPGPTGPQGPTGPTGATGATGPAGGLGGYTIVTLDEPFDNSTQGFGGTGADCPAGTRAVGGGALPTWNGSPVLSSGVTVFASAPKGDGTGWDVDFSWTASILPNGIEVRVACASVAP